MPRQVMIQNKILLIRHCGISLALHAHNHNINTPVIHATIPPAIIAHSTPPVALPAPAAKAAAVDVGVAAVTVVGLDVTEPPVSPAKMALAVDRVGNVVWALKLANCTLACDDAVA